MWMKDVSPYLNAIILADMAVSLEQNCSLLNKKKKNTLKFEVNYVSFRSPSCLYCSLFLLLYHL